MIEKRTPPEMIAEYLREAAVLVLVFVPLDATFADRLTLWVIALTIGSSGLLLAAGVILEIRR